MRRYLARALDLVLYGLLWSAFLGFVVQINPARRTAGERYLDLFIACVLMLLLEPLWLHFAGTTPGKAIFDLRIEHADGRVLSYREALRRTWRVITFGMAWNIPVLAQIRLWFSYRACKEQQFLPWDDRHAYTMKDTRPSRGYIYVGAWIVVLLLAFVLHSALLLPPNRGPLTVAQFVENVHYYARFYGVDLGPQTLSSDGRWEDPRSPDSVLPSLRPGLPPYDIEVDGEITANPYAPSVMVQPPYHFQLDGETIQAFSFEVEYRNAGVIHPPYGQHIALATLAFVGAQPEMTIFSTIPQRVIALANSEPFQQMRASEAGIAIACDTEFSGYFMPSLDTAIPVEDVNYFHLKFSLEKSP